MFSKEIRPIYTIISNQINEYIEPFLFKALTGFRKNHIIQHSLLKMLENLRKL